MPNYQRVSITVQDSAWALEHNTRRELSIFDESTIAKLRSLFPKLGTGATRDRAAGWYPAIAIRFQKPDGQVDIVLIQRDFRFWSEGHGDWDFDHQRGSYLLQLLLEIDS